MDKPEEYENPAVRRTYGMLCGAVGIGLNILLFAAKYLAGVLSALHRHHGGRSSTTFRTPWLVGHYAAGL